MLALPVHIGRKLRIRSRAGRKMKYLQLFANRFFLLSFVKMNKIGNGIDLRNEKKVPSSTQETNSLAKLALHQVSNPILAYFSSLACALDVSHDKTLLHEFRAQIGCPVTN